MKRTEAAEKLTSAWRGVAAVTSALAAEQAPADSISVLRNVRLRQEEKRKREGSSAASSREAQSCGVCAVVAFFGRVFFAGYQGRRLRTGGPAKRRGPSQAFLPTLAASAKSGESEEKKKSPPAAGEASSAPSLDAEMRPAACAARL